MLFDTDVIVVGAGPAGSLAAYILATQGIQVTLLEKTRFPRYKVCGGGLTHKILKEIPFDLTPVIESTIHSFRFSHQFEHVFTRNSTEPLIYCTMRGDLDAFLLQKAADAGATISMGEKVTSFLQDESGVTVSTQEKTFRSRMLIGAEGASGIVSRTTGLQDSVEMGLAWEAEVNADPEDLMRFSGTVFLDWGTLPGGYAWVFPKKDHFSIGVGGPARLSKAMMPYYERFMTSIGNTSLQSSILNSPSSILHPPSSNIRFGETRSLKSWPIPVRTRKSAFHKGFVMVTGDSAGLGDPLTGEGIYYAVRSGKLAAETCSEYLSGRIPSLETFSQRINDELMTELLEANRIKHVFNTVPIRIHSFVRDSDRAWKAFGKILRGERWYADVRNGFGKWKIFWRLACFVSGFIERRKETKFLKRQTAEIK
ncbi:MAG: geranylgeranyl reductase family protein [Bacteroidetes bacterium]|nr:geranylgeranyl reductase family protein [Bacteroidota bacterium]